MNIALLGAGGKMGRRLTGNLRSLPDYKVCYVESSEERREQLASDGINTVPVEGAISLATVVVLAIPRSSDRQSHPRNCANIEFRNDRVRVDPAAAYAGVMPDHKDVTYFIAHPCHPLLFSDTAPANQQTDWFGGQGALPQSIVCSLFQGPEEHYAVGEELAARMFARPVPCSPPLPCDQEFDPKKSRFDANICPSDFIAPKEAAECQPRV
jgi:hypothetical protein